MKRKSLLFLLLFALLAPWAANAQTVTIGTGTGTNNAAPIDNYYNYSFTEMLYSASEIGNPSVNTITSVGFESTNGANGYTYGITIYMKNVSDTELGTSFIAVSNSDIVFEGSVTPTAGWVTIDLDNIFTYDNSKNLLIAVNKTSGSYAGSSYTWNYTTTTNKTLLGAHNDGSAYNPTTTLPSTSSWGFTGTSRPNVQLTFAAPPTCPKPTNLACINTTTTSAELTWNPGGSETNWVLQYDTDANFTAPTQVYVNSFPYTLTYLTSCTTYYARVKADCRDESDWSNTVSFTTKQEPIVVGQGWSDDFEGTGNWFMVNGNATNAWYIGTAVNNGGDKAMYVSNDGGTSNAYTISSTSNVFATKLMTFAVGQYIFTYDWQAKGESCCDWMRVVLAPSTVELTAGSLPTNLTSSDLPTGWFALDGGNKLNDVDAWQNDATATVDITTADDYYVIIIWHNDGSIGTQPPAAIDNFEITKVSCAAPTALGHSNVSGHTATLSWTSDGSAWQVAYTTDANIEPDDLTPTPVTTNSYQLSGLTAETTYYVYVRTDCGGTYSAWASDNFTTTVACPAPTGLAVTLTLGDGTVATLTWTENGTATDWDVEYGTDPEFGNFTVVNVAGTPSTQLTGLTPETTYYARVKTYCGGEDGYSTYSNIVTFTPTDALTLTVNDGTATNSYVPVYGLYVDEVSKSQFIIPAESISDLSNYVIDKLTFYASQQTVDWGDAEFEVYFAEVDYTTFSAATLVDWSSMTNVMSGSLGISGNQMVVELETPYIYNGGNLLIGVLETTSGTFKSSSWYGVSQSAYTAIGGYESSKALNRYQFLPKVTFDVSEVPSCFRPNSLAVDGITARTANLTWVAGAEETAWQVCINGDETNLIEVTRTAYAMEGLTPGTTYTVKVRSNCGEGDFSDWTNEVSFTTEPSCYAPTDLTASDLSFVSANISWTSENENIEMHYRVLTDPNNDFEASSLKNWKSIDADGDGYGWVVGAESPGIYHNPTAVLTGNGHNGSFDFVISGSFSNVTGLALTPDNYLVSPQINLGGSITFWAQAQDASFPYEHFGVAVSTTGNAASDFTTIQEWTMTAKGTGAKANPGITRSGNRVTGNWYEYTVDLSDYAGETGYVAIRHFDCTDQFLLNVDDITVVQPNYVEPEWIDVANVTNPYTLTGLQSATCYEIEVRANCGTEDGYSAWTWAWFLTPSACAAPVELNSIPLVTSATLEWEEAYEGFQQASYNLRYREYATGWTQVGADATATGDWTQYLYDLSDFAGQQGYVAIRHYNVTDQYWLLVDDVEYGGTTYNFDDGELPTGWTLYDLDGDNYNWQVYHLVFEDEDEGTTIAAYSGEYGIISQSFINNIGALNPDNWIILPYGDLSGTLTFYAKGLDPDYAAEVFGVYVLPAEEIAFENNNEWIEINGITDLSYVLEHLNPTTTYEWQVQGVNSDCDGGVTAWSEIDTFTTHDYCDNPDLESFEFETLEATTATLTWVGYQDSYNVEYAISTEHFWDDFSSETLDNWTYDNLYYPYVEDLTGSGLYGYPFVYDEETGVQTLISKEIRPTIEETILKFYYASIGTSTFRVGYSSTDNNLDSFTWGDVVTASSANFTQYVDENVPAGTKYFAVQFLSGEEDGFLGVTYFYVYDDIEVEWVELTVNEPSVTMEPLDPETTYDVYVQGICDEIEEEYTEWAYVQFTTLPFSQTLALASGVNWVSFYVDITLNDLKAALVEALPGKAVTIQAKAKNTSYNPNNNRWTGQLRDLDLSQSYRIIVPENCEAVLVDEPVDSSEHPITVNPGINWITFPFAEGMPVANAFAGFANRGDALQSKNQNASYNGNRWNGQLRTLEPGQGYIYNSATTGTRTFTYPASKAAQNGTLGLTPSHKPNHDMAPGLPASVKPVQKAVRSTAKDQLYMDKAVQSTAKDQPYMEKKTIRSTAKDLPYKVTRK